MRINFIAISLFFNRFYKSSHGSENEDQLKVSQHRFGNNKTEMVIPKFWDLFMERATAPFFVFQVRKYPEIAQEKTWCDIICRSPAALYRHMQLGNAEHLNATFFRFSV